MARFEAFWDVACDFRQHIWLGVKFCLFLFVLGVVSVVLAEPGSASAFLAQVNLVLILLLGTVAGGMYWVCVRRERKAY